MVLGWLKRLVKEGVAFILTRSRPTDELAREFQHLSRFELASFSPEQQSELAARWLGQRASDFERAFDRFANGELGGTPLLLTIAAIVYRDDPILITRFIHFTRGNYPFPNVLSKKHDCRPRK